MGHEATDAEVQQVYDEFWKRIVEPDGELDIEQVKKELFDYRTVIGEVAKVYSHITSNRFSKPTTSAEAVIDATEAHYKWWYSEDEPGEPHLDITHPDWKLDKKWLDLSYVEELMRKLEPGQPCSPGCANHVTHPCEKCGRYGAGLSLPPDVSEAWETQDGWEAHIIAAPVIWSMMAPRQAKEILELVGECLARPGYSVEMILTAIKATPYLQQLIQVAELAEVAGDTDIDCPFCGVVGDRDHLRSCLVRKTRGVLFQVKAVRSS